MSGYGSVKMKDIARLSGVSLSTVSRVLYNKDDVSSESRYKVNAVMEEMGYRPNLIVKALRTGKSQTIGVIASCDLNIDGEMIRGIHDQLQSREYVPVLQLIEQGSQPEVKLLNRLLDRRVDGVIMKIFNEVGLEKYIEELKSRKIPVVAFDVITDKAGVDFVGNDDALAGRLAAECLLKFGHRKLGVLAFSKKFLPSKMRLEAFGSFVTQNSDATVYSSEDPSFGSDDTFAMKLLGFQPRPTAIFVNDDRLAIGVYSAAEKLGLKIPEDLSVIGFGDLSICGLLRPNLTTIRQNLYEIGRKSAELILDRLDDNVLSVHKQFLVNVDLIERKSVAAAGQ